MSEEGKHYWLRKKGSQGPNLPNGILAGRTRAGKAIWTEKVACAVIYCGGPKLDAFMATAPDFELVELVELVEVVLNGTRRYHRKVIENWVPKK